MSAYFYKDYSSVISPTSVVRVKPAAGFWWSYLPALPPACNAAEVLGHP